MCIIISYVSSKEVVAFGTARQDNTLLSEQLSDSCIETQSTANTDSQQPISSRTATVATGHIMQRGIKAQQGAALCKCSVNETLWHFSIKFKGAFWYGHQ